MDAPCPSTRTSSTTRMAPSGPINPVVLLVTAPTFASALTLPISCCTLHRRPHHHHRHDPPAPAVHAGSCCMPLPLCVCMSHHCSWINAAFTSANQPWTSRCIFGTVHCATCTGPSILAP
ncbi:hypothetical protein WOLCODRAFT_25572 [Wolfiporia cocos MD-104 SS10]|uniref:Uncharacterized protein n=1 Tax=Wolfiporia cocos (strain MD-104) TaxID=742152 RepID=A0A2H3K1B9_WOLCO|nr:hypothetical protein WOLCODRAFT_25572 [Wolfiporia cocos MD-104 SS10]